MAKMRAVQVPYAGGPFEIVEREIPEPGAGSVRIKVQACGICHSDSITKEGYMPIAYPRVPGHEVIGIVDALGPNVAGWTAGQRAGIGWNGGYCGYCNACRRGEFFACQTATYITGITSDGGYADYLIARAEALAHVPEELSAVEAAPLMCAGLTTYNCLRNTGSARRRTLSRCSAWAVWGTLASNTRRKWVSRPWPSRAARIKARWPAPSAPGDTSIARLKIPPKNC